MRKLKVGAGKAAINLPEVLLPMGRSEAVKDDVHVRALAVSNGDSPFLLLAYEPGHPPSPEFKREVAEKFDLDDRRIITTSIHNHSACEWGVNEKKIPGMTMKFTPQMLEKPMAYEQIVREGTFQAVEQALSSMQPARCGYGEGQSFINCNRDWQTEDGHWMEGMNFEGPTDHTLAALKFIGDDGNLIAAILNFPCHESVAINTRDIDGKVKITPGFPGYACNFLEKRYDGATVLWTCGAGADQGALFSASSFPRSYDLDGYSERIDLPDGSFYMIQKYLGQLHGCDASRLLDSILCDAEEMPIRTADITVPLVGQDAPAGADMFLNHCVITNELRHKHPELCSGGKVPEIPRVKMIPCGTVELRMQLVILGHVAFVGMAGEPYVSIGEKMKAASPMKNTVIIAPTSRDSAEFIVSDDSADHDCFQAFSRVYPGNNDTPIVNGMLKMFDEALNQ